MATTMLPTADDIRAQVAEEIAQAIEKRAEGLHETSDQRWTYEASARIARSFATPKH